MLRDILLIIGGSMKDIFSMFLRKMQDYDKSVMLIASYLLLVPFGHLSNIPVALMALLGIKLLLTGAINCRESQYRYFGLIFLCFWVPILFSLPDAVNISKTAKVAALYPQYFLGGLYIIYTLSLKPFRHQLLLKMCAFIVLFWVVDALFQVVIGYDFFGFKSSPEGINGIFGENQPKMGVYLAALCSLVIVYGGKYWSGIIQLLVISGASSAIFLASRRSGWIMLMVVLIGYAVWFLWEVEKLKWSRVLIVALFLALAFGGLYRYNSPFKERVSTTLLVFSGDLNKIDTAITYRMPIWRVATRIIAAHPINGVGAHGYRYVYRIYADKNDPHLCKTSLLGASHAHQILLDIGSETGLFGLFGFLVACWLLIYRWLKAKVAERLTVLPYGLSLLAVFFPLNTHYATYSSHWSTFIFWLLALYLSDCCFQMPSRNFSEFFLFSGKKGKRV